MRASLKSINRTISNKWSVVILAAYLWIVSSMFSILHGVSVNPLFLIILFVICSCVSYLFIKLFYKPICDIKPGKPISNAKVWGFSSFGLIIAIYFLYFLGQYPGGLSADSLSQYNQAVGMEGYVDWHPVIHTLLYFTLPIKLGGNIATVVFLQILYWAMAMGYLIYALAKSGMRRITLGLFLVYILINPNLATYVVNPWKDIAFMTFVAVMMACYIQIFATKGEWLSKWTNVLLFALAIVMGILVRHNAVLFVAPLVLISLFFLGKNKKGKAILVISVIVMYCLVKALYSFMALPETPKRKLETIGFPMTIICNVMKYNPEALPEDTRIALYGVASKESYELGYETGSFNSIKFSNYIDVDNVDALTYKTTLKYTYECFRYAPRESFEAVAKLTDMFWDFYGDYGPINPVFIDNDYGFELKPVKGFDSVLNLVVNFGKICPLKAVYGSLGTIMLIELAVAAALFAGKRRSFIHILPMFCYNYGTMLLLSGDDYRFFLYTIVLWVPTVFIMIKDRNTFKGKNKI